MSVSVRFELEQTAMKLLELFGEKFQELTEGEMPGQYPEWFEDFKDKVIEDGYGIIIHPEGLGSDQLLHDDENDAWKHCLHYFYKKPLLLVNAFKFKIVQPGFMGFYTRKNYIQNLIKNVALSGRKEVPITIEWIEEWMKCSKISDMQFVDRDKVYCRPHSDQFLLESLMILKQEFSAFLFQFRDEEGTSEYFSGHSGSESSGSGSGFDTDSPRYPTAHGRHEFEHKEPFTPILTGMKKPMLINVYDSMRDHEFEQPAQILTGMKKPMLINVYDNAHDHEFEQPAQILTGMKKPMRSNVYDTVVASESKPVIVPRSPYLNSHVFLSLKEMSFERQKMTLQNHIPPELLQNYINKITPQKEDRLCSNRVCDKTQCKGKHLLECNSRDCVHFGGFKKDCGGKCPHTFDDECKAIEYLHRSTCRHKDKCSYFPLCTYGDHGKIEEDYYTAAESSKK